MDCAVYKIELKSSAEKQTEKGHSLTTDQSTPYHTVSAAIAGKSLTMSAPNGHPSPNTNGHVNGHVNGSSEMVLETAIKQRPIYTSRKMRIVCIGAGASGMVRPSIHPCNLPSPAEQR